MRRILSLAAASVLSLALVGCGSDTETAAGGSTEGLNPAQTVAASAESLRKGDLVGVIKAALPADKYEKVKSEWSAKVKAEPSSEEEKKEFADMMAKLTAADAETALFAELEPQLAKMEAEMGAQLPLMVGMGRGFAAQAITESTQLTEPQKTQATAMVDALAKWVESAKFFDRDNAKKAIAKAVETARGLEITTLDQVEAMDFEQAMGKAGKVYLGVQDIIAIYGLNLDAALASVKTEVVSETGDNAKVKVAYTLFDQPLSLETDMVRRDNRWFGKEALAELEKELSAPAVAEAPAEEAPADAAAGEGEASEETAPAEEAAE